ncbi:MAG: HYR domain-containing protein, partial [Phycisphaerae bacterium]
FVANITSGNSCSAFVSIPALIVSDACDSSLTITRVRSDGLLLTDAFPKGSTTITNTATDDCGNFAVFSQTVTVNDLRPPLIVGCPANIGPVPNSPGLCGANVSWTPPTLNENCPGGLLTSKFSPGAFFPVGTTMVTYTGTDAAGNTPAICTFTVTVVDSEPPAILGCPMDITVNNDPGTCGAAVSWSPPTTTDNCMDATISGDAMPGDTFPVGMTKVTYTATDGAGNQNTCSFNVIVEDAEAPTLSCPMDPIVVNAAMGECSAEVDLVALAALGEADNCGSTSLIWELFNDVSMMYELIADPMNVTLGGIKTIRVTASDPAGNETECEFTLQVVDDQPPTIMCPPQPGVFACSSDAVAWIAANDPVVSDNCVPTESLKVTNDAPTSFMNGDTIVTYQVAEPGAGLSASCSVTITVDDSTPPVLNGLPSDDDGGASGIQIIVNNDMGQCYALVAEPNVTVSDNCPDGVSLSRDPAAWGGTFPVGTTTFVYTATDFQGNTTSETVQVVVIDNELPTFTCPDNIDVNVIDDLTCSGADVDLPVISDAADNCAIDEIRYLVDGSEITSPHNFPIGTTQVTVEVEDVNDNIATCTFDVTVLSQVRIRIRAELLGVTTNVSRCLRIKIERSDMSCDSYLETFNFNVDTGSGRRGTKTITIPCDSYEGLCISVEDPVHTLLRRGAISVNGAMSRFEADFLGAATLNGNGRPEPSALNEGLIPGDIANNDGVVEVGDFAVLIGQFLESPGATTCDWTTTADNNADLDGDGIVEFDDFNLMNFHWLLEGEMACCESSVTNSTAGPRLAYTIGELIELGQADWAIADLNQDGVLDRADVDAFADDPRPQIRGDLDGNLTLTTADIAPFITALIEGQAAYLNLVPNGNYYTGDLNRDGFVTVSDISGFVEALVGGQQ